MNYEHLLVSASGAITTITLNRPEKRNALALPVMLELTRALRAVAQSDALGVILAANGPVFSAGHNFGDMAGATLAQARDLFCVCTDMMDAIQATTAAAWGLINKAVPADQLDTATLDLISRATRGSALSKATGKHGFYQQIGLAQEPAYQVAIELMSSAAMTPDAQEGIRAFLEKRPA